MAQGDPEQQPNNASAGPGAGDELPGGSGEPGYEDEFEGEFDDGFEDDAEGEPVETVDEQGRRHIRRAAPEGTEQILENETPRRTGLSDRAERWRMRSATGTVLTAFAFGLREAFEPNRNEPAIIMETSGDPPKDLPVEAELEQLGPRRSSVTIRKYLLAGATQGKVPAQAQSEGADGADGATDKAEPDGRRPVRGEEEGQQ